MAEARENACGQIVIGVTLNLIGWEDSVSILDQSQSEVEQNQKQSQITVDIQLRITKLGSVKSSSYSARVFLWNGCFFLRTTQHWNSLSLFYLLSDTSDEDHYVFFGLYKMYGGRLDGSTAIAVTHG